MDIDANKLKAARSAAQLSQKALATMAGVSRTYVSGLESGRCDNPDPAKVDALAKALNVSTESICSGPAAGEVLATQSGKKYEVRCTGGRRRLVEI